MKEFRSCPIRVLPAEGWDRVLPVLLRWQQWSGARSQHSLLFQKPRGAKHGEQPGGRPPGYYNTGITCNDRFEAKASDCILYLLWEQIDNKWLCGKYPWLRKGVTFLTFRWLIDRALCKKTHLFICKEKYCTNVEAFVLNLFPFSVTLYFYSTTVHSQTSYFLLHFIY